MGVIYKITSPRGKIYVGKTYDLRKRINCHKHAATKGSNIILHNSIRKYGWDNHVLDVIENVIDEHLNEREIFWISKLNTYCYENSMGMNMTRGGDGQRSTWMHKTELRKWYSERFSGDGNPFYGKKHSNETKKIIADKAMERNKVRGITIPQWGIEKGRNVVRKSVILYDSRGDFVSEHISITECANKNNIKLSSVKDSVLFGSWIGGSFLVKYKTDNYPLKISVGEVRFKDEKKPIYLISENFEIICEYKCAQDASEFWGIPKGTISRASRDNYLKPIRTGHIFIYKDLWNELRLAEAV